MRWNKEVQDWLREPQLHDHFRIVSATCESPSLYFQANTSLPMRIAIMVAAFIALCEVNSLEQVIIVGPRNSPYTGDLLFWLYVTTP
jgi:hypothetical protein